jgi:hypothetical protein
VPTKNKHRSNTSFQAELQRFFSCLTLGIRQEINAVLSRTCRRSLDQMLQRADFGKIPNWIELVTTTPADCSDMPIGVRALRLQLERHGVGASALTTLQPTSFGANLDEAFWKEWLQICKARSVQFARVVVPRLCVLSRIQRQRLKAVPTKLRSMFEDLVFKDSRLNQDLADQHDHTVANVPHFKLYFGSDKTRKQIDWLLMTSMSMSLGAAGRSACPNNMYAVHTNQNQCKCAAKCAAKCKKRFVGRNFELGVLFLPQRVPDKQALANIVPFW